MSAVDFRAFRATVIEAVGELQTETEHDLHGMSDTVKTAMNERQWCLDQLDVAYAYMVEHELFPNEAAAEEEMALRAEERLWARKTGKVRT
jgi:hypothetical protein